MRHLSILGLWLLLACGRTSDPQSHSHTIYEDPSFEFLSTADLSEDRLGQSMGALLLVLPRGAEVVGTPVCSSFAISPRHVLSAAHCYRDGESFAFEPFYRAVSGQRRSYIFEPEGDRTRLSYLGSLEAIYDQKLWRDHDRLGEPVWLDRVHDFVIWELSDHRLSSYVDWRQLSQDVQNVSLYAYPNSNPLARSTDCTALSVGDGAVFRHDCDSLSGSSGGLLFGGDGLPLGLHSLGPGANSWSSYQANGRFETAEEQSQKLTTNPRLAQAPFFECKSLRDESSKQACLIGRGWNRALSLAFIRDQLTQDAPSVASAVFTALEATDASGLQAPRHKE